MLLTMNLIRNVVPMTCKISSLLASYSPIQTMALYITRQKTCIWVHFTRVSYVTYTMSKINYCDDMNLILNPDDYSCIHFKTDYVN